MKKPPLKIARAVIYVCLQMLMRQVAHIPLLDNQHVDWGHIPFLHIWMSHTMKSLYCLLIVLSRTVAFTSAFLLYFISLIVVALLEFTQQVYLMVTFYPFAAGYYHQMRLLLILKLP